MKDTRRRRFSLIRSFQVADFLTIANGCAGVGAVFHAMRYLAEERSIDIVVASVLVPIALVFDVLDGRIARHRHESSLLGREMDSLADVISFGVAPAAIAFALGLSTAVDQAFLTFFVVCGVSRLARYNVTADQLAGAAGKVSYYEGTPIPTSVVPLALVIAAAWTDRLLPAQVFGLEFHLPSLLFVVSGSLMISTIRIRKL
jgi:CDP-diacylglycerol--serine O-phosphatidyltransferase